MQGRQANEFLTQNPVPERILYTEDLNGTTSQGSPPNQTNFPVENFLLIPLGLFAIAWGILLLTQLDLWKNLRHRITSVNHSHQIPCSNCQYFNRNPYLKCAIHPSKALNEEAINCADYCSKNEQQ